ncbi:UMP kinase [Spiroplasma turonicum]|uniref:Uridylate kinase n=1 Tax=Spiroplasma turonicum TaxID=216946 RepID=A0A0K1P731_9MOLU|nr:UMP kinase [Spiroplasma turonicum]AKU80126.1 uridylate kinase [Spiroplasma turonicum]ALX71126.1 uridylate kinase [Spiroplasma turonicum]
MALKYKRVLLKISGEALKGKNDIYDKEKLEDVAKQVIKLTKEGLQIGIVIGGGNIWRGKLAGTLELYRIEADYMGMLATIMNALAFEATLRKLNFDKVKVYSSLEIKTVTSSYNYRNAREKLEEGYVVLFAGGTGYSYFTTDTGASIRAIEIKADALLMAKYGTKGVYDKDPNINKDAKFYDYLTHNDLVTKNLQVMDSTAATLSRDGKLEIVVFDIKGNENIVKVAHGDLECSVIK